MQEFAFPIQRGKRINAIDELAGGLLDFLLPTINFPAIGQTWLMSS